MATKFFDAPEVEDVIQELKKDHRDDLKEAEFKAVFRKGPWQSKGRIRFGIAQKISGAQQHIMGIDFLITINQDEWNSMMPVTRRALVDHELEHCCRGDDDKQGNPTWYIQGHDIEDFAAVLRRHGLWSEGLKRFDAAARQIELSFAEKRTIEAEEERVRKLRDGEEECPPAA